MKQSPRFGFHRERFKLGEERETKLNEVCPEARERFGYYFPLPLDDYTAMLKWRRYVRQRCIKDLKFRAAIWEACRRDFAFFCATFVWIFEPRPVPRHMPFFPFTSQVSIAAWLIETFGVRSSGINKTRGIGLSWLVSAFIKWKFYFDPKVSIAVISEDEGKLDRAEGSNSLLGKFQYIHDHMPEWVKAKNPLRRIAEDHIYANKANGALVQGFVSREGKLRGDRFTWLFADEFAFYNKHKQEEWMTTTAGTVNSRCFCSTWNDFDDMFHKIMHEEESALLKISAFWWNDFERWQGAYKMVAGRVELVDKDYHHPPDYPFGEPDLLDHGFLRSPWVDGELLEPGVDKIKTLRDLYGMSVCERTNLFFPRDILRAVAASIQTPSQEGLLQITGGLCAVLPTKKSDIRFWAGVPGLNKGPYTCYCDLGGGADLAYSVATFLDKSGQQVCEYATKHVEIVNWTGNVFWLARWLAGAEGDGWVLIDFDNIGPLCKSFTTEMIRLGYGNMWRSQITDAKARRKKEQIGETPTYFGTSKRDAGLSNFGEMARAILGMECVIRSDMVLEDMRRCSRDQEDEGKPRFPKPTGNLGHGDFAHAVAGAWWRLRSSVDVSARDQIDAEESTDSVYNSYSASKQLWSSAYS